MRPTLSVLAGAAVAVIAAAVLGEYAFDGWAVVGSGALVGLFVGEAMMAVVRSGTRWTAAVAATLAAGLAAGKVLSPQFLLWLLPVALLVAGRYGRAALGIALAAMLATGIYFPHRYWDLVALETLPVALLLLRDALLIALVAACWPRPHIGERADGGPLGRPSEAAEGRAERAVAARYLTD